MPVGRRERGWERSEVGGGGGGGGVIGRGSGEELEVGEKTVGPFAAGK